MLFGHSGLKEAMRRQLERLPGSPPSASGAMEWHVALRLMGEVYIFKARKESAGGRGVHLDGSTDSWDCDRMLVLGPQNISLERRPPCHAATLTHLPPKKKEPTRIILFGCPIDYPHPTHRSPDRAPVGSGQMFTHSLTPHIATLFTKSHHLGPPPGRPPRSSVWRSEHFRCRGFARRQAEGWCVRPK